MAKCIYCDQHFKLCHNGKSEVFLRNCPKENKSCEFFVSREAKKRKTSSQVKELDWTEDSELHWVHVFKRISDCFVSKHKRTDYLAKVAVDTGETIKLRIFYCHQCKKYFANGNLLPERDKLLRMRNARLFDMQNGYYDMQPESILRRNGYSAKAGTPPYKRHRVLDYVIESGELTPYDIINHLGSLIDWHYGDYTWYNAISKWEEDIAYVQSIDVEEHNGKFRIVRKNKR